MDGFGLKGYFDPGEDFFGALVRAHDIYSQRRMFHNDVYPENKNGPFGPLKERDLGLNLDDLPPAVLPVRGVYVVGQEGRTVIRVFCQLRRLVAVGTATLGGTHFRLLALRIGHGKERLKLDEMGGKGPRHTSAGGVVKHFTEIFCAHEQGLH